MRINTNITALNAQRNLAATNLALQGTTTRLSSGFRINRAGDDAAGLSIANMMRGDVRALQQASRNASQAGSVLQVADGATGTIANMLDRMKELATLASSANVDGSARAKIQAEVEQLKYEINRITQSTKFQGANLLDGSFGRALDATLTTLDDNHADTTAGAQDSVSGLDISGAKPGATYTLAGAVSDGSGGFTLTMNAEYADGTTGTQNIAITAGGADTAQTIDFTELGVSFTYTGTVAAGEFSGDEVVTSAATFRVGIGDDTDGAKISLVLGDLTTTGLGINSSTLATAADADTALTALDAAYSQLNDVIGQVGAAQNRLEFASINVGNMIQNTMAAESTIRDADMAFEMMQFSKQNILAQAGTAMLAQANSLSQSVLQLLR